MYAYRYSHKYCIESQYLKPPINSTKTNKKGVVVSVCTPPQQRVQTLYVHVSTQECIFVASFVTLNSFINLWMASYLSSSLLVFSCMLVWKLFFSSSCCRVLAESTLGTRTKFKSPPNKSFASLLTF